MIIYLCCPYSHEDYFTVLDRVNKVNIKAGELMDQGHIVFSPISHSHPISIHANPDPFDHDFWLRQDLPFMSVCDEVYIYCIPGWENSKGIKREIEHAERLGKPVRYIS